MDALHDIINRPASKEDRAIRFIDRLRTVAPKTWVAIELARGTWKARLSQLAHHQVLRFDARGIDTRSVLEGQPFRIFHHALRTHREGSALSNVHDAAALAMLHGDIHSGESDRLVRFYTETHVVSELWRDQTIRELLSYRSNSNGLIDHSVLRDADYFNVRANFDALRFEGGPAVNIRRGPVSVPIDELERVANELTNVVEQGETRFESAIQRLYVGEQPLTDTVRDLESLSFVRNVWFQYEPPEPLLDKDLWNEVWDFSDEMVAGVLDTELATVREQLRAEVSQIETWSYNFRALLGRVVEVKTGWRAESMPEPLRDLGIIRWGINLEPAESDRLRQYVMDLMSVDDEVRERTCVTFATLIESAPPSLSDTVITVCVLWFLRLFQAIINVVDEHERLSTAPVMPSLLIMRAAARLRAPTVTERPAIDKVILEVVTLCEHVGPDLRKQLLLGSGFVLYYAFLLEKNAKHPDQRRLASLARRSFEAGDEAVQLLPENTLAWAFAMNHCAYVGTVTGVHPDKTSDYHDRVVQLRGSEFWHYRFADSVAWHHILLAKDELRNVKKLRNRSKGKKRLFERIREAQRLYEHELGDIFGDIEILGHRMELNKLALDSGV